MSTIALETPAARFTAAYRTAVSAMIRSVLEGDDRRANRAADAARSAAHRAARFGSLSPLIDQLERHYPELSEEEEEEEATL